VCCFVLVLGLLGPRLAFLYLWLFTPMVSDAFGGGWIVPLLGLLLLPWTSLLYTLAWSPLLGVTGIGWFVVALGVVFDLATYSGRAAQRRYEAGTAAA
jgi:hypothetical protein